MIVLTLPYPPSVNAMWRTPRSGPLAGRTMLSQEGRQYRKAVEQAVVLQRGGCIDASARLAVDIECRMPDRRKRDLDNLPKAILDALTHAGLWADDSQVDELRVWRSPQLTGQVVVKIRHALVQPELLEAAL